MTITFPIRPCGARVIVLRDEAPSQTSGGLFLPETARQSSQTKTGTVVEVGPGAMTPKGLIPVGLKIGDRVFFGEYAGVEIKLGTGKPYTIMKEEEVIGTLEYQEPEPLPLEGSVAGGKATLEERTLKLVKSDMNRSDPT